MNKEGKWTLWASVAFVAVFIVVTFFYFALFKPNNAGVYSGMAISNPAEGLTTEQAVSSFDEGFLFYLLYSVKAYNLHNPPLSSDAPRMEIYIDDEIYGVIIQNGLINVSSGRIPRRDVILRTTREEAVKMMNDRNYVSESFNEGKSVIELAAGKTTLFAKGYLNMYNELIGKSVTGNVIRIATG